MVRLLFVVFCLFNAMQCSPLQKKSSLSVCDFTANRQQCAYEGCSQYQCEQEGCCYNENSKPFCFSPHNSTITTTPTVDHNERLGICAFTDNRTQCGDDENKYLCEQQGCCYTKNTKPFCYFPNQSDLRATDSYCDKDAERTLCDTCGEYQCKGDACCWDTGKEPYCFLPTKRTDPKGKL